MLDAPKLLIAQNGQGLWNLKLSTQSPKLLEDLYPYDDHLKEIFSSIEYCLYNYKNFTDYFSFVYVIKTIKDFKARKIHMVDCVGPGDECC